MTTWNAPADDRSAGAHEGTNRTSSLTDLGQVSEVILDPARVDAARLWFAELLGDLGTGGYVWLGLRDGDGWHETGPFRPGAGAFARGVGGQLAGLPADELLEVLARSAVAASNGSNVFACPYPQAPLGRRQGAARLRRHVHCDIDGPVDMGKANMLGAMVVASGSVADDGQPHGHVYLRLDRLVTALEHKALCRGLATYVGGACADLTKITDENMMRVPGTLNHKTDPPRPVEWLVGPDDKRVRSGWGPEDLARLLHVEWPVSEPLGEADEVPETPTGSGTVQTAAGRPGEAGLHPYAARAIGAELARLDDCARLGWATESETGKGWDVTAYEVSCNLLEFANSPWSGYTLEQAHADLLEHAPRDHGFGPVQHEAKWESAVKKIRGKGRPAPQHRSAAATSTPGSPETSVTDDEKAVRAESDVEAASSGEFAEKVRREAERLKVRDAALKMLDAEKAAERRASGRTQFVNLAELLADGQMPQPPTPVLLHRTDGLPLFYKGRINRAFGDTASGKTWLTLAAAAEVLGRDEGRVLHVDVDSMGWGEIITRLCQLGVPIGLLADPDRFRFAEPATRTDLAELVELCHAWRPTLAVVDSFSGVQRLVGGSRNNPDEVADMMGLLAGLATDDTAVALLDHLAQSAESRRSGPSGTLEKGREVRGVSLRVVPAGGAKFSGEAWLSLEKDTSAGVARQLDPDLKNSYGELRVGKFRLNPVGRDPQAPGSLNWAIEPPTPGADDGLSVEVVDTLALERVSIALEGKGKGGAGTPTPLSQKKLADQAEVSDKRVPDLLDRLEAAGYVRRFKRGQARMAEKLKPYRAGDPLPDADADAPDDSLPEGGGVA